MTIQSVSGNLLHTLQQFQQPGWYLLISAAAFLLILLFGKKTGRVGFVYPFILFALCVFNPYIIRWMSAGNSDVSTDLALPLRVLPFALITASGLFSLLFKIRKIGFRILVLALFGAALVLTGVPAVTEASYYDVSTDHLEGKNEGSAIADLIAQNMDSDTCDVYVEDEDLASQIRTENAGLSCTIGNEKKVTEKSLSEAEADYYVVFTDGSADRLLSENKSCTAVGKSRRCTIYKS